MTTSSQDKRSHAYANIAHRERKAEKILRLIETDRPIPGCDILEVGAGAGIISRSLSRAAGATGSVEAVDVVDERVVTDGYRFTQVNDATLPFSDASFDIVVSNHVIEHVGPTSDQLLHLREIRRVLRPNGIIYLAAPNRWTLIEPHYRLPLLSWLPHVLADVYVRHFRGAKRYDCWPTGPQGMRRLFALTGLVATNLCPAAVKLSISQSRQSPATKLIALTPAQLLKLLTPLMPSLVYVLRDVSSSAPEISRSRIKEPGQNGTPLLG